MTEIDVPDWVVEVATEAYSALPARTTFHDSMRAALTAALGAWVVQVGIAEVKKLSERTSAYDIAPRDWSFYLSDGNHTLYTLRQEKPE